MRNPWLACLLLLMGCRNGMVDQPRTKPFSQSAFFADGASARLAPADTVPAFQAPSSAPVPIDAPLLARGQERFDIYCVPCHGLAGDGDGIVTRHGFGNPPSFHLARLQSAPASHFYTVITRGYGAMFSYADRIAPDDRWAIIAYIRALQLSRAVPVGELSAAESRKLEAAP